MKIKKLKPREYNAVNIKYPDNEKLMNKINELIDIVERQQKEINELKFTKLDNPAMYLMKGKFYYDNNRNLK